MAVLYAEGDVASGYASGPASFCSGGLKMNGLFCLGPASIRCPQSKSTGQRNEEFHGGAFCSHLGECTLSSVILDLALSSIPRVPPVAYSILGRLSAARR